MAEDEHKTITSTEVDTNRGPRFAFLSNFGIKFPPPKQESKTVTKELRADEVESEAKKPDVVRFPDTRRDIPPLKLEVEESEQGMDPRNMWQVYALGGFLILKWILARWNERRPKDESPDGPSSVGND
ncbi:uncharacterized protein LOC122670466 [Telopea speciosissima]|uniref:uncharacterized protein LOC122670466 n=1 Tax=Telopea speciosissima TaxID=54955 RepID=UPI001CC559B1|nr:uncharacterized protein LOC122670466 [Telopea speciosissima]